MPHGGLTELSPSRNSKQSGADLLLRDLTVERSLLINLHTWYFKEDVAKERKREKLKHEEDVG